MIFSLFFEKVVRRLRRLAGVPILLRFRAHNQRLFRSGRERGSDSPIMLMELNAMHSCHIPYSYMADEMAKIHGAQIKAYAPNFVKGVKSKFLFCLKALVGFGEFGVYKSFGVNEFFYVSLTRLQRKRAAALYDEIFPKLKSRRDLEDLHIEGVWIGDLIYDSYLMAMRRPTIELESGQFKAFLLESIELYTFWSDFFREHSICGVNVSHCVYNVAIPLRIAVHFGIPAFQANLTHVYRLDRDHLFAYNDFIYFRDLFAELPLAVTEAGIALAQRRIERRFSGEVGVDMHYSSKSAYVGFKPSRLLRVSGNKKILIAVHCFFDSPHSYGKNIFPDFHDWLSFLGEISEVTDYDWYIKTHPDFLPGNVEIINGFLERFPKFTLLPADASHHQIIAEGIDVALTTYGTIGFEYAALGIPVINASMNNPHIAYDFNVHVPDVESYRRLLVALDDFNFAIDKRQVYEYYFMRFIYNTENLFCTNYREFVEGVGGYQAQFSHRAYESWLAEWNASRHEEIVSSLRSFILSGVFRMVPNGGVDQLSFEDFGDSK